jgi:hypothetical protein
MRKASLGISEAYPILEKTRFSGCGWRERRIGNACWRLPEAWMLASNFRIIFFLEATL